MRRRDRRSVWRTTFKKTIKTIGKLVLVLSPWNDPLPLTRAWCLWEIFSAATEESVVLEIVLPEAERPKFLVSLYHNYESLMDTLVRVQVERSECSRMTDQERIFSAIKQSCGFGRLNETVKDQLRGWLLKVAVELAEEMVNKSASDVEAANFYDHVGLALQDFGDLKKALVYYQRSLPIKLKVLGGEHESVGSSYNNIANIYLKQGQFEEALE